MSEPIKFRSEGERADWTLAFRESDYSDPVAAGLDADDFLAERRKREGPTEGEIEKAHDLAAGAELREGIAIDTLEDLARQVRAFKFDHPMITAGKMTCLDNAEALVAAARGTK